MRHGRSVRAVRDAEQRDYRWSAVINGIVASPLFRMRRSAA
jgi:hypothetical protein